MIDAISYLGETVMGSGNANEKACFTCDFWDGSRSYEPHIVKYQDQMAKCESSSCERYNQLVQPGILCLQSWKKWRKLP